MPISRKQDFIRDIFMMVRKESVSFEPQDRVKLGLRVRTKEGESVSYYVGDVFYDFDSGRMCFNLFNGDGHLVVPGDRARVLEEQLTGSELKAVSEKVSLYTQKAIYRAKNMALISEALDGCPERSVTFSESNSPRVCIDRHRSGSFVPAFVRGVYKTDLFNSVYLAVGSPEDGEAFSYPSADLSDMGVSTLLSSMERELGRKLSSERKADSKQARKDVLNHSM